MNFTPFTHGNLNLFSFKRTFERYYNLSSNLFINSYLSELNNLKYECEMQKYLDFIQFQNTELITEKIEEYHGRKFEHFTTKEQEYIHTLYPIRNLEDLFFVFIYIENLRNGINSYINYNKEQIRNKKREIDKRIREEEINNAVDFYNSIKDEYPELKDDVEALKKKVGIK